MYKINILALLLKMQMKIIIFLISSLKKNLKFFSPLTYFFTLGSAFQTQALIDEHLKYCALKGNLLPP